MPPRNPQKIQLDFPQLTADVIRQLLLTGAPVGLLDFLPSVQPVYVVAERNPLTVTPIIFSSGAFFTNSTLSPAANAVLADTGPLTAGTYDVFANGNFAGLQGGLAHLQLQHRDAADAATLATLLTIGISASPHLFQHGDLPLTGITIAANERLRWQWVSAGAGNGNAGTTIAAQIRAVP